MGSTRAEFYSLYLTRFAGSLGFITILTLLPTYIDVLDPSGVAVGLFITALGVGRTVAIVPLSWAGDRYDKRTILLIALVTSISAYLLFAAISSSLGFIAARTLQGLGIVGTGLISLALISELAPAGDRANVIGKYNSWRMAAGIIGTLGAGLLYQQFGFTPIFAILALLLTAALLGVWLFIDPDDTSVSGFALFDLAFNQRILTLTSFRAQYAVAVTLVRKWVPIYVGVSAARGGLALSPFIVGTVIAAEKFMNMVSQPYMGRLSDRYGRALFVFAGGGIYGLVALAIPFAGPLGSTLGLPGTLPVLGNVSPAYPVVLLLNGLLGLADSLREPASMALFADEGDGEGIASSFGIRSLVWRPGAILAPIVGGYLMSEVGMEWVFFLGGAAALSGVLTFVLVLSSVHGQRALAEW
ncbi:MFS transporter [Halorussus limi]|uniref:MFS transporter n=2 Tax=Halorussus TaxID=1070314 RepID=A0A8U0IGQ9_9EURY|nr:MULTISPECIES: MFS transporter [Halorussus]UPV73897.1 MFS transporter [Halorussus limi]UPV99914.1 MFS transporter [Halorussus gelatinilyticus]